MKRPITLLLSCAILSALLVLALYSFSNQHIRKNNSFLRIVLKDAFSSISGAELKYNSYYIAGATRDHVYLANVTAYLHLLVLKTKEKDSTGIALTDSTEITLKIKNVERLKFKRPRTSVMDPYFYIMDGVMPGLYRGKLNEWKADSFMFDKAAYFIDGIPFSSKSFAIKSISSLTDEQVLGRIKADSPYVKFAPGILQKQIDGKFCTDGMLHYDRSTGKLVYLYYYRNQYMVMDTSMNVLYRGNTIDTISHAKVSGAAISSERAYTMDTPPVTVNETSCVSNGLLFVKSPLLSKNEYEDAFKLQSAVDVYDLKDGTYKFSFYIPKFNGKSFREFRVVENTLIVLYDQYLEINELNAKYFSKSESVVFK
ncbi:hypothetical protein [Parachryseolinea silvisoli]|uniref:hypothetical protein n=1 Tax=Parachryseolinea silvisoli TaxID=2873601 RepID=UPI0022659DEF|nr:hypothetical protein [Parachryseolinea silvisoli]MCD9014742.1 hypothetical protein [Parachryseolinea silvisoli]